MILNGKSVADGEFFDRIVPIDEHFKKYMVEYILPDVVAFYLKECYYKECLCESPFYSHVYSSLEMLCDYHDSIMKLIPMVAKALFIKYNLKIVNYDPLEFEIVDK